MCKLDENTSKKRNLFFGEEIKIKPNCCWGDNCKTSFVERILSIMVFLLNALKMKIKEAANNDP